MKLDRVVAPLREDSVQHDQVEVHEGSDMPGEGAICLAKALA